MAANSKDPADVAVWIIKVIRSCTDVEQLKNAVKLITLYLDAYGADAYTTFISGFMSVCNYREFELMRARHEQLKTLYIFDLDDTLIKTTVKVKLRDEYLNVIKEVDSATYNNMELWDIPKGCVWDFTDFNSEYLLRQEKLLPAFEDLRHCPACDTYLLTARGWPRVNEMRDVLHRWLEWNNVEFIKGHIIQPDRDRQPDTAKFKADELRLILQNNPQYERVAIYEDIQSYIDAMVAVVNEFGLEVTIVDSSNP